MLDGYIQVGEVAFSEAKRLKAALGERGVRVELMSDPEQCGSCSPKIGLCVAEADAPKFKAYLEEERLRSLGDLEHDPTLTEAVFDSEQAEATCPACGTRFATTATECPDCGLGFGGP